MQTTSEEFLISEESRASALLGGAFLGQRDALQRERHLAGERGEAHLCAATQRVLAEHRERTLQALAYEQRRQAHLASRELEHDDAVAHASVAELLGERGGVQARERGELALRSSARR